MLCLQRSPSRAAYERRHSGHFETDHMIIADVRCCGLAYCIACMALAMWRRVKCRILAGLKGP